MIQQLNLKHPYLTNANKSPGPTTEDPLLTNYLREARAAGPPSRSVIRIRVVE
jgi:hypothetical protein